MKEYIYSRNAVYETMRAKRREVFKLEIAETAQEKGHLKEIFPPVYQQISMYPPCYN